MRLALAFAPLAAGLGYVHFNPPAEIPGTRHVMTPKEAESYMVDSWARTDPIVNKALVGKLTPREYAQSLNYPSNFVEDNEFHTFFATDEKGKVVFQIDLKLDEQTAPELLKRAFTAGQVEDLSALRQSVLKRLKSPSDLSKMPGDAENDVEVLKTLEAGPSVSKFFSKEFLKKLRPYEIGAFHSIVNRTPLDNVSALGRRYSKINAIWNTAHKSLSTAAFLGLLGAGSLLAARSELQRRANKKSLMRTASRLATSGKTPSVYRVLAEHVGSFYAGMLSVAGAKDVRHLLEQHLNGEAQARADRALAGVTSQFRKAQLNSDNLRNYITGCYRENTSPLLYAFWGGHKETKEGIADSNDDVVLKRLNSLADNLRQSGLRPPRLRLIFTDTHARVNGAPGEKIGAYYRSLLPLARKYGIEVKKLSELEQSWDWKKAEAEAVREIGDVDAHVETILKDDRVRTTLAQGARKHSLRYSAGKAGGISGIISDYAKRRLLEGRVLEKLAQRKAGEWQGIHLAFADPHALGSLINLPTLFLYTMEQGDSRTPWFTRGNPLPKIGPEKASASGGLRRVLPFRLRRRPAA